MLLKEYIQLYEDFNIYNIDVDKEKDFKNWLDSFNKLYFDEYKISFQKENECGGYDEINYYITENIIDDKRIYKLYSSIYDLEYQNEEKLSSEKWDDIIDYIANEEGIIIEYDEYYKSNYEE